MSRQVRFTRIAIGFFALAVLAGCDSPVAEDSRLQASRLGEGLAVASAIKSRLAEYYLQTGEWPPDHASAGLRPPAAYAGKYLRQAHVTPDGVIVLTYTAETGVAGGTIHLVPNVGASGRTDWQCTSPSYPNIAEYIPQCRHES